MVSIRPEARPDADEIITKLKEVIIDLNNKIMSDLSYAWLRYLSTYLHILLISFIDYPNRKNQNCDLILYSALKDNI